MIWRHCNVNIDIQIVHNFLVCVLSATFDQLYYRRDQVFLPIDEEEIETDTWHNKAVHLRE